MAAVCTPEYAAELAEVYMSTIGGASSADPVGVWCTPGDVTQWKLVVDRIREAITSAANRNTQVQLSPDLQQRIAKWALESLKVEEGSFFPHAARRVCEADVVRAINFASNGVALLAELHCEISNANGVVPDPPPMSVETYDPGLPGPDWAWYTGAGLVALLLIFLIRRT